MGKKPTNKKDMPKDMAAQANKLTGVKGSKPMGQYSKSSSTFAKALQKEYKISPKQAAQYAGWVESEINRKGIVQPSTRTKVAKSFTDISKKSTNKKSGK